MTGLTWGAAAALAIALIIVFGSALLASAGAPVPDSDKQWLQGLLVGAGLAGSGGYALGRRDGGNADTMVSQSTTTVRVEEPKG